MYIAEHVVDAPGASVVTGQLTGWTLVSDTSIPVNVTLPVLVMSNVYGITDPAVFPLAVPACLAIVRLGSDAIAVSVESFTVTTTPDGDRPKAVAELAT